MEGIDAQENTLVTVANVRNVGQPFQVKWYSIQTYEKSTEQQYGNGHNWSQEDCILKWEVYNQ